ncbi:hypothetical protein GOODEAATRI_024795 [Goodea atripinnis]|uniref:Uncharacterized protein n=1 Tax=Goodea atripinnis TaxID=208336 RepID=A0ABV0MUV6_9TELE
MKSSQPSTLFSSSRFRSSSVTAWDSLSAASPGTTPDNNCSDGESGTPSSDHAFLIGLDVENQDTLQQIHDQKPLETEDTGSEKSLKDGEDVEFGFVSDDP